MLVHDVHLLLLIVDKGVEHLDDVLVLELAVDRDLFAQILLRMADLPQLPQVDALDGNPLESLGVDRLAHLALCALAEDLAHHVLLVLRGWLPQVHQLELLLLLLRDRHAGHDCGGARLAEVLGTISG